MFIKIKQIGSIYLEKIEFDGKTYRTKHVNMLVDVKGQQDNILTRENTSFTDAIKPQLAAQIQVQIATIAQPRIANIKKIDDIHFHKNGEMKCEINDHDLRFTRQ